MILEEINISTQELQALALLDRFVKVAETVGLLEVMQ